MTPRARRLPIGLIVRLLVPVALVAGCASSTSTTAAVDGSPGSEEPTAVAGFEPREPVDGADPAEPEPESDLPGATTRREVPPLVLPRVAPGSDDAWVRLVDELSERIAPENRDTVPWPDPRNPDPVAAYRSSATFQNWMSEHNPTPVLVEAYTAPASPERGWDLEIFGDQQRGGWLSQPADPPYSMRIEAVVHPAATSISDTLLSQIPEGSVAIVYFDSYGSRDHVADDGTVLFSSPAAVDVGPWAAIMAPTDVGWQVWWDELTDPPPPPPTVEIPEQPNRSV